MGRLVVRPGARLLATILVTEDDDTTPISLAGLEAKLQARTHADAVATMLNLSSTGPDPALTVEPGGATGTVAIDAPASLTEDVTQDGVWDILAYNPGDPDVVLWLDGGILEQIRTVTIL